MNTFMDKLKALTNVNLTYNPIKEEIMAIFRLNDFYRLFRLR